MLRVTQCQSAEGAKSYYSRSDYLSEGQELVGRWGGKGAAMLGLSGQVDKASFDMLCDNCDPRSGERLTLRDRANRTVGYDFTFNSPKGVSAAYLIGGDDRILAAFQMSVEETMRNVEKDALTRVRKDGRQEERQTGNLVWGGFDHFTTREVEGEVDPHLHGHRFVFNVTWDSGEQASKAVQFRELKRDASYYEAAFHARFAARMKGLGYDVERHGRDWDIAGFDPATKETFSRRTRQIEALAEELGIERAEDKDQLGATSRGKKNYGATLAEVQAGWERRLNPEQLLEIYSMVAGAKSVDDYQPSLRDQEAMAYARLHCFERDSVVPKRKVLTEALRYGLGDVSVEAIDRQYNKQNMITRSLAGREWATTPEMLAEESAMLRWARDGINAAEPLNSDWTIKRDWLNSDQRDAIDHLLKGQDRVLMLRGGAGTGKTALMKEAIEGMQAGGREVYAFAPSAEASRGVLAREGVSATTVAELLVNEELQKKTRDNIIWIDEAGMLGSRTLKQVMDIADEQQARLVLSGDWRQHGSVEAGAPMRLLEQQGGIRPAVVRKIQRQDGAYREAVALLAEGDASAGLDALKELGWVHEIGDTSERLDQVAKRYADGVDAGESVLAIAPTHVEADMLHDRIRAELREREVVGKEDHALLQLKPMQLTEAAKTDQLQLEVGNVAVFHQKAKGYERNARVTISAENRKELAKLAKRYEVYRRRSTQVARGDLIRITRNGKTKDKQHSLNNGAVFRVEDFNSRGDLVLTNGWTIDRDYGFIASGYVSTSHASQGKTVDRVLIAESSVSYPAAGREQFYVSVSRGRKQAEIFTDDVIGLAEAIGKTDARLSATELVYDNPEPQIQRQRMIERQQENAPQNNRELVYERD